MKSAILTEYIQSIVDNVVHHNEPFDDSKKKWLRNYGELEHLEKEEIDALVNHLGFFFGAIKELKTRESRYIETMVKKAGQYCCLSESQLNEYINITRKTREEDKARMKDEIQSNIAATENEKQLCQKETDRLAKLKSDIVQLQDTKAKTIDLAEKKAFEHIEPQWEQEQEALSASKKRCESIKNQISQTKNITADWQDKTKKLHEKADSIIEQRKKLIHHILLIALGVFFSLAEFLLFEDKWVVCVPCILNVLFIILRLLIMQDQNFKDYPEFLFTFFPLVLINYAALIVSIFDRIWLLSFFLLIPTAIVLFITVLSIYEIENKQKATHHFLLVSVALLVSLFEFFSFGCYGLDVFDDCYGWGWAIPPFLCNMFFVLHRLTGGFEVWFMNKDREWEEDEVFFEYLYSTLSLAVINGFAIWVHNGWVLALVVIYPALRVINAKIYEAYF